jgi:hypothetical protein
VRSGEQIQRRVHQSRIVGSSSTLDGLFGLFDGNAAVSFRTPSRGRSRLARHNTHAVVAHLLGRAAPLVPTLPAANAALTS